MSFRVPEKFRLVMHPMLGSDIRDGNNGAFRVPGPIGRDLFVVASDGLGWEHVSVSLVDRPTTTPTWPEMCAVKDLFWSDADTVVQFHPARKDYRNFHQGCLHLWRPVGREMPLPDGDLVGPAGMSETVS